MFHVSHLSAIPIPFFHSHLLFHSFLLRVFVTILPLKRSTIRSSSFTLSSNGRVQTTIPPSTSPLIATIFERPIITHIPNQSNPIQYYAPNAYLVCLTHCSDGTLSSLYTSRPLSISNNTPQPLTFHSISPTFHP